MRECPVHEIPLVLVTVGRSGASFLPTEAWMVRRRSFPWALELGDSLPPDVQSLLVPVHYCPACERGLREAR